MIAGIRPASAGAPKDIPKWHRDGEDANNDQKRGDHAHVHDHADEAEEPERQIPLHAW